MIDLTMTVMMMKTMFMNTMAKIMTVMIYTRRLRYNNKRQDKPRTEHNKDSLRHPFQPGVGIGDVSGRPLWTPLLPCRRTSHLRQSAAGKLGHADGGEVKLSPWNLTSGHRLQRRDSDGCSTPGRLNPKEKERRVGCVRCLAASRAPFL